MLLLPPPSELLFSILTLPLLLLLLSPSLLFYLPLQPLYSTCRSRILRAGEGWGDRAKLSAKSAVCPRLPSSCCRLKTHQYVPRIYMPTQLTTPRQSTPVHCFFFYFISFWSLIAPKSVYILLSLYITYWDKPLLYFYSHSFVSTIYISLYLFLFPTSLLKDLLWTGSSFVTNLSFSFQKLSRTSNFLLVGQHHVASLCSYLHLNPNYSTTSSFSTYSLIPNSSVIYNYTTQKYYSYIPLAVSRSTEKCKGCTKIKKTALMEH